MNKDFNYYRFKAYNIDLIACFYDDLKRGTYSDYGKLVGCTITYHPHAKYPFYTCICEFNPKF